jgi:hypothetical protein
MRGAPLISDEERRKLDEIARTTRSRDPDFARRLSTELLATGPGPDVAGRLLRCFRVAAVTAYVLLLAGAVSIGGTYVARLPWAVFRRIGLSHRR